MFKGQLSSELNSSDSESSEDISDLNNKDSEVDIVVKKLNQLKEAEKIPQDSLKSQSIDKGKELAKSKTNAKLTKIEQKQLKNSESLKTYFDSTKHLNLEYNSHYSKKTGTEYLLDQAIKSGNTAEAEVLSSKLGEEQFESKIKQAETARNYENKRKQEEETKIKRKRKKLNWTFTTKDRWETKSNM